MISKAFAASAIAAALLFTAASGVQAQATATQTATFEVQAINDISFVGNPEALVISSSTAGSGPDDATDSSTTWGITTNETGKKVTGEIDSDMPTGVTLKVNLAPPAGATSAGDVILTQLGDDLVTDIANVSEADLEVSYTLSATSDAGAVASDTRTVTFTIVDGA